LDRSQQKLTFKPIRFEQNISPITLAIEALDKSRSCCLVNPANSAGTAVLARGLRGESLNIQFQIAY
jgi:hypothetical protein